MRGLLASRPAVVDRTRCGTILLWYNMRHSSSCTFFFFVQRSKQQALAVLAGFLFLPFLSHFLCSPTAYRTGSRDEAGRPIICASATARFSLVCHC